ncbi:MAG: hypothetical protein V7638_3886 [Acidobacteriota bacterium]|jgi:hypothetical protein
MSKITETENGWQVVDGEGELAVVATFDKRGGYTRADVEQYLVTRAPKQDDEKEIEQ